MITGLLICSLLAGMWAEKNGSVAARPLIASVGLVCALTLLGVPFDFGLWVSIDVAAICIIEALGRVGKKERAIMALFPVAWVLYHLQPPWWRDGVSLIVTAQFLLTVPWDRLEQRVWKARAA